MKEDIWKEMEEDLRKKCAQTGRAYEEPLTAEESLDMLENSNPFEAVFMFMKYAIKHYIKQIRGRLTCKRYSKP